VPQGFNYMLADRAKAMTMAQWEHLGLKRAGNAPFPHGTEKAYLLAPAGSQGPVS
jgi:membrane-bound lytic murein transglycosylase B